MFIESCHGDTNLKLILEGDFWILKRSGLGLRVSILVLIIYSWDIMHIFSKGTLSHLYTSTKIFYIKNYSFVYEIGCSDRPIKSKIRRNTIVRCCSCDISEYI